MNLSYPPPKVASLSGSINDFLRRFPRGMVPGLLFVGLGGTMGVLTALVLYVMKPVWVALLIGSVVLVMPSFVVRDNRLYWLGVFLFTVQFEIQKNLNDGLAVIDALGIDYTIWNFTFEVRATDLIFLVLAFFWIRDVLFCGGKLYFPRVSWLIVGFLACCLLSLINAPSAYLGLVEISRQLKFFAFFLYAANNIESKAALRLIALMAVAILVIQGAVTALRFETGWMTPLTFGETHQDKEQILQILRVDRDDEGAEIRAFGTLSSPGSTLRLCLMVIPFALMLGMRNPMYGGRPIFLGLTAFAMGALFLTFTRAYYLTTAAQVGVAFLLGVRHRYLSRMEILLFVVTGFAAVAASTHKLYEHFQYRPDSVSVRFEQYKAAIHMALDNPVLGVGLNNGTDVKEDYVNVTFNEHDADTQFYKEPTHNLYLSLVSEIGFLGGILYFTFFGHIIAGTWRMSNDRSDPELQFFANIMLVVLAGVVVNASYDPLHEAAVMTLLWLYSGIVLAQERVAALDALARRPLSQSAEPVRTLGMPSRTS